MILNPPIFRYI